MKASGFAVRLVLSLTALWALLGGPSVCQVDAKPRHGRVPARPLVTGISGIFDADPSTQSHLVATGARFAQIVLPWGKIAPAVQPPQWQPTEPTDPHYDWSSVDPIVLAATHARLTPVLILNGAPRWAQRCVPPVQLVPACNPDPQAEAAFAIAAARRYSGAIPGLPQVRYWQALNEPNLSLFLTPQFDAAGTPVAATMYRDLINSFYFAVKSVSQSNLVLIGGLGPNEHLPWTLGPMQFARELLCMRGRSRPRPSHGDCFGGVHFDIFDIHPYSTGGPTHKGRKDDVQLGDLKKLTALIAAADRAHRVKGRFRHTPIWSTELAWDSSPPDPRGLPMRILTRWTAEALYRLWAAGIDHVFWYQIRDPVPNPSRPSSENFESGLYFRGATPADDRPKPNMKAFRFPFVAYSRKGGFHFWGRTPNSRPGKLTIQIRTRGKWRKAASVKANRNGIFEGFVKGLYGRDKRGFVRARYRGEATVPFSLHPVKDFYHPPFG